MGKTKKHKDKKSKSKHSKQKKKYHKRRKHNSSSSDSSSSSSTDHKVKRKIKKTTLPTSILEDKNSKVVPEESFDIPISLMSKSMAPMTKEQWEKEQSVVKRVFDESTGRHRLIKGSGEVLEEIVSRDRHMQINKQATKGDGNYFQANVCRK